MADWKSENIGEIAKALAKSQSEFEALRAQSKAGKAGGKEWAYANLADTLDACRATLNKNGIAVVQLPATGERNGVEGDTILIHGESGQWIHGSGLLIPCKGGAQDVGSAITYWRRYSLLAMVGLAPEDDDGKAAQAAKPDLWRDRDQPRGPRPDPRPAPRQQDRDPLHPRASAGVANAIVAMLKTLATELEVDDDEKKGLWEDLLGRAGIDLAPYMQHDRKPPGNPRRLTRPDAATAKKHASLWIAELATDRAEQDPTSENAP